MTPLGAAKAYGAISPQALGGPVQAAKTALDSTSGAGPADFAQMVSNAIDQVGSQAASTDAVNAAGVAGKADLVDVVTAISESELAMDTLVGLRDRVIGAYEQIMRMPI